MSSKIQRATKEGLIQPPKWLAQNMHYEVLMGSTAYGVADDKSDMDIYGFCIPPKELTFPHLAGEIPGFGTQIQRFENYQQHHVVDASARKEYDFSIYSIVKFFDLAMTNNPNMVDALFVPQRCVLFCSEVGQMVRDNRRSFLHKGSYHKFRGYAYAQLHKIGTKGNSKNPKRQESIERFGYDVKFAYHVVRLCLEVRQILEEHDLDITAHRELLKGIRRGQWSLDKLKDWFDHEEKRLEELYHTSTLRHSPDEGAIKELLMSCLEHHYGSISHAVKRDTKIEDVLRDMQNVLNKYGSV